MTVLSVKVILIQIEVFLLIILGDAQARLVLVHDHQRGVVLFTRPLTDILRSLLEQVGRMMTLKAEPLLCLIARSHQSISARCRMHKPFLGQPTVGSGCSRTLTESFIVVA